MELRIGMWFLATLGMGMFIVFWHKKKTEKSEQIGFSNDFSNLVLYFDPIHGEGHLFLGGIVTIVSFSMFCYELAKTVVRFSGYAGF